MARPLNFPLESPHSAKPHARILGRLVLVLLTAAMAPLAFDGLKVCVANWMAITKHYMYVETPAFDAVMNFKQELSAQSWQVLGPILRDPPWHAGCTIFLAAGWATCIAWVFRSHPH
jgi:hypothetical protein